MNEESHLPDEGANCQAEGAPKQEHQEDVKQTHTMDDSSNTALANPQQSAS